MTQRRLSVPSVVGVAFIALGLVASPILIDGHIMSFGKNVALAMGGGGAGGGGGGGPGAGGGPGPGPGSGGPGANQGMGMQQGPMSQGGMVQHAPGPMMSRDTIRSVQRRLNQLGYRAGPEDGMMGPQTRRGISAYQAHMGMAPDGMLTPGLIDRLMAELRKSNTD